MVASLHQRKILVVGRESGIARSIAVAVRELGANVVVAGRDAARLAMAYDDPGVVAETVDLTNESSVAALAGRLGQVDHIVSTASARARGRVGELGHDTMLASFDTKVMGPIVRQAFRAADAGRRVVRAVLRVVGTQAVDRHAGRRRDQRRRGCGDSIPRRRTGADPGQRHLARNDRHRRVRRTRRRPEGRLVRTARRFELY